MSSIYRRCTAPFHRKEKAHGNEWLNRYGILFEPPWSAVCWQLELVTYRWDPWLHARVTGDASVRDSTPAGRRRVTQALRAEGGGRKDRLILRVLPFDRPPHQVAGILREVIDQVLAKHGFLGAEHLDLEANPRKRGGDE